MTKSKDRERAIIGDMVRHEKVERQVSEDLAAFTSDSGLICFKCGKSIPSEEKALLEAHVKTKPKSVMFKDSAKLARMCWKMDPRKTAICYDCYKRVIG